MASKQDFIDELNDILIQAKSLSIHSVDIVAKDLHDRTVAKIRNNTASHRMSSCSDAMQSSKVTNYKNLTIVNASPSELSSTLQIRYDL